MHLLSVTLNLIRRFTKRQVPRGGLYGGLVILAHPRLMVRECTLNIRTLQRLVIHIVARVLNRGFWFSKNTRISKNTTSITNRQELLTPKVQHYSSQYLKTIASYYFKENNYFNYLLSSQDTELSATAKLSNKIKHATYRNFNLRKKKICRKTKALQLNRPAAKKRKRTTHS